MAFIGRWAQILAVEAHSEPNAKNLGAICPHLEPVYRAVNAAKPQMPVLALSCKAPLTRNGNTPVSDYVRASYTVGGGR